MLATMQAGAGRELRERLQAGDHPASLDDDLLNLEIIGRHALMYERRWLQTLGQAFDGWPRPVLPRETHEAFELVSEAELWSQLVGQPVIDTLDRRFEEILDTLDSRFSSLSAAMGGQGRPLNPVSPRVLVEGLLQVFPENECNPGLRSLMLRHFEQLAGENLGGLYNRVNKELSDAGVAMSRASDYAALIASSTHHVVVDHDSAGKEVWSSDNAVPQVKPTWRDAGNLKATPEAPRDPLDATRGNALRSGVRAARMLEQDNSEDQPQRRMLSDEEFLAVLSLLQADDSLQPDAQEGGIGSMLQQQLTGGASRLGLEPAATRLSEAQQDAVQIVGRVFDRLLATFAFSPAATRLMQRLAYPYLHLALTAPYLFDQPDAPAHHILSTLVELWDANQAQNENDAELHALADATALQVIDAYHGEAKVLDRVQEKLDDELEPRTNRTELSLRRTWQSILGQERLQAARLAADTLLGKAFGNRLLLPSVAGFLDDQWRQALIHVWLREGPESGRYRGVVDVGEAIVRLDAHAADANGHALAEGLIAIERPLRDCHVAYGMDEAAANRSVAAMIAELSRPDEPRARHTLTALANDIEDNETDVEYTDTVVQLDVGQRVIWHEQGQAPQALRVAWISPGTGRHLLINRQGARQHLLGRPQLAAWLQRGVLVARPAESPFEYAVSTLLGGSTPDKP